MGIVWMIILLILDVNKDGCNSDLSGLKLSVKDTNPCSKLLCTEVKRSVSNI